MVAERRAIRYARALNRVEAARVGNTARLEQTSDWDALTASANKSPNHSKNLDYWRRKVQADNPALSPAQVDIVAERKRSEYFRELGRRSGVARAAKSSARAADEAA